MTQISVIIPCYNAAQTVGETIESALAQDGVRLEVIVIDDGSTDGSAAVLNSFGTSVRAVSVPNRGASSARNLGTEMAQGAFLQYLDADDSLAPGTLALRLHALESSGADVACTDWQRLIEREDGGFDPGDVRAPPMALLEDDAEAACASAFWAPPVAILFRRETALRTGGWRLNLPIIQDARFLFDAAAAGARFVHVPGVGAYYRVRSASLSRANPGTFWLDVLVNAEEIEAFWRTQDRLSLEREAVLASIYNNAARGLFAAAHPAYLRAVERQKAVSPKMPLHPRVAAPLAWALGVGLASRLVGTPRRTSSR